MNKNLYCWNAWKRIGFVQLLDRFHRGSRESRCTTRTSAERRSSWTWTLSLQATSLSSSRWESVTKGRISPQLFSQVKGIPAKISDFGLRGMLRVVFKPLVSRCLKKMLFNLFITRLARYRWSVGFKPTSWRYPRNKSQGCQNLFLKFQSPEIDYELGGVGDFLNLPGLHKILEQTITEQV